MRNSSVEELVRREMSSPQASTVIELRKFHNTYNRILLRKHRHWHRGTLRACVFYELSNAYTKTSLKEY